MYDIEITGYLAVKTEEDETGYALFEETYTYSVYTDTKGVFMKKKIRPCCT